jgi:surfeit locus 1 family protein
VNFSIRPQKSNLPNPYPRKKMTSTVGLSNGGKAFFGGLCVGTFGLGCWQLQRLQEKLGLMEERERELTLEPTRDLTDHTTPYRRRLLEGTFRHDKEVLIGPRGAPNGVRLPRQGLSKNNQSAGGMTPGPQGYHVLTPLELSSEWEGTRKIVWVNRGWVPKTMVPSKQQGAPSTIQAWSKPTDKVAISTILSAPEKPRTITAEHDYSKRPLQLFWLDGVALQAIAESDEETMLLTQVNDDGTKHEKKDFPLTPPIESIAEFKTTPAIHVGYAATWFGLSGAGMFMTRKLITRGRG